MATLLEKPEVLSTIPFKGLYGDLAWPQWPNIVTHWRRTEPEVRKNNRKRDLGWSNNYITPVNGVSGSYPTLAVRER